MTVSCDTVSCPVMIPHSATALGISGSRDIGMPGCRGIGMSVCDPGYRDAGISGCRFVIRDLE